MKKIVGLEEKVKSFDEKDTLLQPFKEFFQAAVKFSVKKSGEEAVDLFEILLKLKSANGEVDLEDAQFKLLKACCNDNPVGWPSVVHGQLFKKLQESEK